MFSGNEATNEMEGLPMEQIKIFSRGASDVFDELEHEVNQWLSENENIEILSRKVTSASGVNILNEGFVNCTIFIFYRPKA